MTTMSVPYRAALYEGNIAVMDNATGDPFIIVGKTDRAQQWAAWWVDVLAQVEHPAHPALGLEIFSSDDAMLFVFDGLPVGTIGWNGREWWWYTMDHWGNQFGEPHHIDVDVKSRLKFQDEWERVAEAPESLRDTLRAELGGRLALFRDETASMAVLYGKFRALRRGRHMRELGIGSRCTGYLEDDDANVCHDGNTCPVHEEDSRGPLEGDGAVAETECRCGHKQQGVMKVCPACGLDHRP